MTATVAQVEAKMNTIITARTTAELTRMYTEAQTELRSILRITEQVSERAAFRRVLGLVGNELFARGYIMCTGCMKWQNDHPNGSCFRPSRPAAERVHLNTMLTAPPAALPAYLKGLTVERLLEADKDASDQGMENRQNGASKLDKDQLIDVRDRIDAELNARGWDYCFVSRKFEDGHPADHCL